MKIKETIRKQRKRLLSLCMIGVFILALFWGQQEAKADWWDPVYVYSQAGNNAIFRVVDTEPRVYFASYGKAASGGTKYLTVGWKIYLRNSGGEVASYVFSCGGSKVHNLPSKNVNGYIYSAYFITLKDIRDSIGAAHFNNPNYTIWMDAYNTVIERGTTKGGVSDGGATWGEVYSTYDGIANARGWSATTKENMHSMFNKQIVDIYRNLYVQSGDGITSVSGGGTYVYGSSAVVKATEKTGYSFKNWTHTYGGGQASTSKNYIFEITGDTYLTANATGKTYYIHYDPGAAGGSATSMPASQSYTYSEGGTTSITTTKPSWKGHTFLGWSTDKNASSPSHAPGTTVAKKTSDLQLYALWKTNSYTMTNNFYKEKNGVWVRFGNSVDHTLLYGAYFKNTLDGFTGDTTGYHFWRFATDGWYVDDYNKNDSDGYGYFLPNEYTIRYDGNGATSGVMKSGAIAGNSHTSSLKYDVSYRLTTNDFKRTGYHFLGWATSRDQANRKVVNYSNSSGIKNLTATHGATITKCRRKVPCCSNGGIRRLLFF